MRTILTLVTAFALFAGCAMVRPQPHAVTIGPLDGYSIAEHQVQIQQILDDHAGEPTRFVFTGTSYHMSDPGGIRVPTGATLDLRDATFLWPEAISADGQTFLVENAANVTIRGGHIKGSRSTWDASVNVAGIRVRGQSHNFSVDRTRFSDLSSNAIGVFGESDAQPIRNIRVTNVATANCCNYYGDYLDTDKGPAKGSLREDQGSIALYHVDGWLVDKCAFAGSQSDGTHFFHAHHGAFTRSSVTGSKMGGCFLEGCEDVVAEDCVMDGNGSRGVTIERDSRRCTLRGCVVRKSGREGLWAPDVADILVVDNEFVFNGQKDDGAKDCEIRVENTPQFATNTAKISIGENVFRSAPHQTAIIMMGEDVTEVKLWDNQYEGSAPLYLTLPPAAATPEKK